MLLNVNEAVTLDREAAERNKKATLAKKKQKEKSKETIGKNILQMEIGII